MRKVLLFCLLYFCVVSVLAYGLSPEERETLRKELVVWKTVLNELEEHYLTLKRKHAEQGKQLKASEKALKEAEQLLEHSRMRIQSLEAILQNKEESIGNLRAYIQRLERQLTALAERLNEAEKALDDLANSWTATVIKTAVLSGSAGIIIGVIIGIIVE